MRRLRALPPCILGTSGSAFRDGESCSLLPIMAKQFEAGDRLVNIPDERGRKEWLLRLAGFSLQACSFSLKAIVLFQTA